MTTFRCVVKITSPESYSCSVCYLQRTWFGGCGREERIGIIGNVGGVTELMSAWPFPEISK
jgi:hypothetical protein